MQAFLRKGRHNITKPLFVKQFWEIRIHNSEIHNPFNVK